MKYIEHLRLAALLVPFTAACQLNDHDSAPPAPDLPYDDNEQSTSPAQPGTVGNTASGDRSSGSSDAGTPEASAGDVPSLAAPDAALPTTPVTPDASFLDGGFPTLPSLDAGTLPPGNNFGTLPNDAGSPLSG